MAIFRTDLFRHQKKKWPGEWGIVQVLPSDVSSSRRSDCPRKPFDTVAPEGVNAWKVYRRCVQMFKKNLSASKPSEHPPSDVSSNVVVL